MGRGPRTIAVTQLQRDVPAALKRVRKSRRPLLVTQGGRTAVVLLSLDAYKQSEHERQILRLIAKGEQEIAAGKGYDLKDVLTDAAALLSKT